MKKLLRVAAVLAGLSAALAGGLFTLQMARAGALPQYTGPAGANPIQNPTVLGDVNGLINGINTNVAPAFTGSPSQALGFVQVVTTTMQTGVTQTTTLPQIETTTNWTTTTSTSGHCGIANATGCFYILDPGGQLRGIPFN